MTFGSIVLFGGIISADAFGGKSRGIVTGTS